ncbi:hypothetical protein Ae168Ps1_1394c [Pseudonocardia sp. Ae168_Ps1]|nr:hypothetical protein Ae150APs1_1390c [Pseudonocardia sp. Ae150A_Ps1]OLL78988.1 hypothetical protein Ae168Ps1_1394c [Pseudonocardia sp. Ae168_Ps1]OLL86874.1 hypothetical protein Ae263Ps1_3929 [Pseudonocardia sp. Ae263_Ps1]OLL93081.1 hypothetical protein Ae356Ps1_2978c [Pseudonocardia sp. Ae356_Ps1]
MRATNGVSRAIRVRIDRRTAGVLVRRGDRSDRPRRAVGAIG